MHARVGGGYSDTRQGPGVAAGAPAHPVVGLLQTIQANGQRAETGGRQALVHLGVVEPAVGDDAPADAAAAQGPADLREVRPQQRLSPGQHDGEGVRAALHGDGVEGPEKVLQGHIDVATGRKTITAAVAAVKVATGGALPEQVVELVHRRLVGAERAMKQLADHSACSLRTVVCSRVWSTTSSASSTSSTSVASISSM